MRLSLALAALVAVVPAFANTIPSQARRGTTIPLSKRAVKMKDDKGVANKRILPSLADRTSRNLRRGLAAYESNKQKPHPSATRATGDVSRRDDGSGGAPLIDDNGFFWYATISVGTPPVNYTVEIDTNRSNLLLPGSSCGASCQGRKVYDTTASSTAKDLDQTFSVPSGGGPPVQGEIFSDTVTMAGLTVSNLSIGLVSQYGASDLPLDLFRPDGFIGFGFSSFSQIGTTFFENLVTQGGLDAPQFSVKVTAEDGEISLGGVNHNLFTGEFTTVNVTQPDLWQVTMDSVNAAGHEAVGNVQAIIDFGYPNTIAPMQDAVQFYKAIPGSKDASDTLGSGLFTIPCDTDPQVSFTFGGRQFDFPGESFIFGQVTEGSTDCYGSIVGTDDDVWFIGADFLGNYYTSFDFGALQVAFADLA